MALQTWVARFVVENGRVTEEGGRLRTFQRRRLDEPDADLHLLAEPAGLRGEDLAAQSLDAIGHAFIRDRLTLTGGLQRALRSTRQTLADWNRRSVPREQVSIGIIGAIVSGNVVYLAQAGPGLVFFRRDGRLRRIGAEPNATGSPLGDGEVEPLLRRFDLAANDLLLAASSSLDSVLDPEAFDALLARGSDEALPELYLLTRDQPNFALFTVTCFEVAEEPEPLLDAPEPRSGRRRTPPAAFAPPPAGEDAAPEAEPADQTTSVSSPSPLDISRPVIRLRGEQTLSRSEDARTTGPDPRFRLQPRNVILGAILAALAIAAYFTVPGLISEDEQQRLATRVQDATLQLAAATDEADPGRRRVWLEEARLSAGEALRIDPDHPTALDLRQQAAAALEVMDAVFDLGPMATVTTLSSDITGEVSVASLSVASTAAYLLDTAGGRIISVPLDASGPPVVVFQAGEIYGGVPAEQPRFAVWEATSPGGRLLILDSERKLFELRPGSLPAPLPLRRPNLWSLPAGLAAYNGNLYVLDPEGNQIFRYLPSADGFDSEPDTILSAEAQIEGAVALAIDADIYVVLDSGEVKHFSSGVDAGFSLAGIDQARSLLAPTDITLAPGAVEIYIADAGNKRVVVASREGVFLRQFVSNDLTDVRFLAVDPTGGQLYVVSGDALLTAPIVR